MRRLIYISAIICAMLVACVEASVAQNNYLKREMPEAWSYSNGMQQTLPQDDDWWKNFDDQLLDSLIIVGLTNNYNVMMAINRMQMAKAQIGSARAGYWPNITLSAGYTKSRNAGAISGGDVPATNSSYFNIGANMSWEIDLFGKVRASVKNKTAQYNASRAEYAGAMISLAADIASYYFNLRKFQAQLAVTREHLKSQKRVVDIAQARFNAGLVSKLDVAQALTVYYSTEASIPGLELSVSEMINSLAILLGDYPSAMMDKLLMYDGYTPRYRQLVSCGVPANLLRRRPDILEAESEFAAYSSALGIAKKDYLPSLTLNGSIGVAAHRAGDMFHRNGVEYSVAPLLSWTLFDGLSRKYAVAEAREQLKLGIENYNLTVTTAVKEVENAMLAYNASLHEIDSYAKVIEQSKEQFDLSVDLYKEGLTPFTNVVDAQINSMTYAISIIGSKGDALVNLVTLYRALGGNPVKE